MIILMHLSRSKCMYLKELMAETQWVKVTKGILNRSLLLASNVRSILESLV